MSEEELTPPEETPVVDDPVETQPEEDTPTEDDPPEEDINPDEIEIETRKKAVEDAKNDEEDDDVDPEDARTINKALDKRLTPVEQQIQRQNDEIDVNNYLFKNPELTKFKPVILKYMQHPAYSNIPVKNIAAMVSAGEMQKLGAEKERQASKKANDTKVRGTQVKSSGPINWLTASKKDFDAELQRIKTQPRA